VSLHLDTNAYSAFFRGEPEAVFIVEHALEIALSPVTIGELKGGFILGTESRRNHERLRQFLASPRVEVPSIDDRVTSRYAEIFKQLRRDGRPIPTNDMWIAACVDGGGPDALFSRDLHFDGIDGLRLIQDREGFLKWAGEASSPPGR
jgi:tRNA(fMet)-specific endonuclease VapC